MNDLMAFGMVGNTRLRNTDEHYPTYAGGGYPISSCCGARHYDNMKHFNDHNYGVQAIINPDQEPKTDGSFTIEKVQLGKDLLVLKLRGVE